MTEKTYKIASISLYPADIERLDQHVSRLKAAGFRKMNKSALIRWAVLNIDMEKLLRDLDAAKGVGL